MLSQERLAALDLTLWLRSGKEAGERLGITQPNVSRRLRQALDCFALQLRGNDTEWELKGDPADLDLLTRERQIHQLVRWRGRAPLRIEGSYWSAVLLLDPLPETWIGGRHNIVGIARPQELLRQRVLDAWLAGGPDWPEADDPDLAVIPLCRMPVHTVVPEGHPLLKRLQRQGCLSWEEVAAFPSLALPAGAYPKVEACLKAVGLWSSPTRMVRYQRERWEGRSETELMIAYATVLSEQVAGALVRLPLQLPIASGEALVLRREWSDHPRTMELVALLKQRLQPWAERHPELTLVT